MIGIRSLLSIALAVAAVSTCDADPGAAAPKLPKGDGWIVATSPHFVVFSEVGERKSRNVAIQLEKYRMALARVTRGLELDARVPTVLMVFRNDPELTPYKLDESGNPEHVSGYFLPGRFRNYVALDASAGHSPMRVVYHEYFHAVLHATIGDLPLWLDEGLAEYFSTFTSDPIDGVVAVGHPIEEHLRFLAERGRIPWDEVFEATTDSRTYHEASLQGAFYAQSWLAVHYLSSNDQRTKSLFRLLSLLRDGKDPGEAMSAALGMDPAAFAAAVDAYSKKGSNYVWWDLGEEAAKIEVSVRDAAPAEVLFRLGDLLARRGQRAAAERHLEAARAAGAKAAEIDASLGIAARIGGDEAASIARLRSAVEAGAESAEPYALLAESLVAEAAKKDQVLVGSAAPPQVLEAREVVRRGLVIDKDNVQALRTLATTYLFEPDTAPGIEAVERARASRPVDGDLLLTEACLLARGGKPTAASDLVDRTLAPRNRAAARDAAQCVADGAIAAAATRSTGGDNDGAGSILDEAIRVTHDAAARDRLAAAKAALTGERTAVVHTEEDAARIRSYNEAIDLMNDGKLPLAADRLDALAQDCKEGPLCERIRTTASSVHRAIDHRQQVAKVREALDLVNKGKRKEGLAALRRLESEVDDPRLKEQIRGLLKEIESAR